MEMYMEPKLVFEHFTKCKGARYNHENIWQQIVDTMLPMAGDIINKSTPGEAKFNLIFDSTAMMSLELLAGALHGMLTSPTSFFFGLTSGDPEIDNDDDARLWIQSTVRRMHDRLNNSNFQTEVHEYYLSLVGFGNGPLMVEEDVRDVVRFSCKPLREIYVKQNSKGRIDTFYRCFPLNARGFYEEFGEKNVPEKVKAAYKAGKTDEFEILHAVYPRNMLAGEQKSKFSWISQYIFVSDKTNISVEGFREFPLIYGRWSKIAGETEGRGAGEKALPDTKVLNEMTKTTLRGAQKVVDPPLQAPDDGFVMPLRTVPGGLNYYRAGSPATDRISPIFNDSRIDFGFQAMDMKKASIREAFYVNQLQLREGPQMTATEVDQRVEQALRFLAPMLGRQQSEFLAPLVERVFGIMSRRGEFDAVPAILNNRPLKVQYSSVMAASQRASEMQNINRFLGSIAPIAAFSPSVTDIIHADKTAKHLARLLNYPQECLNTQKDMEMVREQRAKSQQDMELSQQRTEGAKQVADVSKAVKNLQPVAG